MTLGAYILQVLFAGLSVGSIYAIVGLGFMVIYSVCGIMNLAHGEFVMLGGMIAATLWASEVSLPLAILISLVIVTFVAGTIGWKVVTDPSGKTPNMTLILFSIGLVFLARGAARIVWGTNYYQLPNVGITSPIHIGGATLVAQGPWLFGTLVLVLLGLFFLFERTLLGKALRANSEQPTGLRLLGISPTKMSLLAFLIGAFIASVAGVVMTPYTLTHFALGIGITIKALISAIVGGITRSEGVVLGGLTLGLLEAVTAGFISSTYKEVIPLAIFLMLMLWRPTGLIGRVAAEV